MNQELDSRDKMMHIMKRVISYLWGKRHDKACRCAKQSH